MTPGELYDSFRREVVDLAKPYLWSEDEVWEFMQEAYFTFWRKVGGIPDFLSNVCLVDAVAGDPIGALHPSILRIMSANRLSDQGKVEVINSTDLDRIRSVDYGQIKTLSLNSAQGKVRYMVVGMARNTVRWIQVPDSDEVIELRVYRLPLKPVTRDSERFEELDSQHVRYLLKWMKHLAYSKQDAETFDKGRADRFEGEFLAYCDSARSEAERAKHKTRVVQYGGL